MQWVPSPTYIQPFLNISVSYVEATDADRSLGTRNGLSSRRGDGFTGENYTLHREIDPKLKRTSASICRQERLGWPYALNLSSASQPRELEL
jgi:hypothetical protein